MGANWPRCPHDSRAYATRCEMVGCELHAATSWGGGLKGQCEQVTSRCVADVTTGPRRLWRQTEHLVYRHASSAIWISCSDDSTAHGRDSPIMKWVLLLTLEWDMLPRHGCCVGVLRCCLCNYSSGGYCGRRRIWWSWLLVQMLFRCVVVKEDSTLLLLVEDR